MSRDLDFEVNRLKAQAKLTWFKEERTLRMFGLKSGMRVLEVPCEYRL